MRAAEELFADHGFDAVSVAEIADRADVGRTTFFRHFRDKQEVVFAQEQELVATITATHQASPKAAPTSLKDAIEQLRDIVLGLCSQATEDPTAYTRHYQFVSQHPDLRARDAVKMQDFAARLADILTARGTTRTQRSSRPRSPSCYQTAKRLHNNDPRSLLTDIQQVFNRVLRLGHTEVG